ncbi:S-layer homology domain-containing protein [Paenibacillus sp. YN15]|uniref:S-layer homology domain-containing protein n=1 Tax=Paenibacillus sp. YN15 TaxID=1742774 RepID=UPI0037CB37E9
MESYGTYTTVRVGVFTSVSTQGPGALYGHRLGEKNFADSHRHWAEHEIRELASSLIIRGVSDGLFAPEADLTRAQFMAMLVRGLELSKHSFSGRVGRLNSFRLLFLRECQHG